MKTINLNCEWCNNEFQRLEAAHKTSIKNNKKEFCCGKCVALWKNKNGFVNPRKYPKIVTLICVNCNKSFEREDDYDKRKRRIRGIQPCCSQRCMSIYAHKHKKYKCRSKLEMWMEENLKRLYPNLQINYNDRNAVDIELDIYMPTLELAFELNGIHHYKPIYGIDRFMNSTFRDVIKEHRCQVQHIDLYILDCREKKIQEKTFLKEIVDRIEEKLASLQGVEPCPAE